jgi:hypothetical protein
MIWNFAHKLFSLDLHQVVTWISKYYFQPRPVKKNLSWVPLTWKIRIKRSENWIIRYTCKHLNFSKIRRIQVFWLAINIKSIAFVIRLPDRKTIMHDYQQLLVTYILFSYFKKVNNTFDIIKICSFVSPILHTIYYEKISIELISTLYTSQLPVIARKVQVKIYRLARQGTVIQFICCDFLIYQFI